LGLGGKGWYFLGYIYRSKRSLIIQKLNKNETEFEIFSEKLKIRNSSFQSDFKFSNAKFHSFNFNFIKILIVHGLRRTRWLCSVRGQELGNRFLVGVR
jgi:hypothetical protein